MKNDSINNLKYYIERDRLALGIEKKKIYFGNKYVIYRFQVNYRKYECYYNMYRKSKNILLFIPLIYRNIKYHKQSIKLSFSIPINVFGPGLSIAHYGTIVVNGNAVIGENCRIQENVTIGATNGELTAPVIGKNVFIGSGAKIIGNITIVDDVAIGAGSVVVKDVLETGITVAGVPAKKISDNDSHNNLNKMLFGEEKK